MAAPPPPPLTPAQAADAATAANAALEAGASVCTVQAAEAFAIAAYIAAGRPAGHAPDDRTCRATYTGYYDDLTAKLLALLAAAPVPGVLGLGS